MIISKMGSDTSFSMLMRRQFTSSPLLLARRNLREEPTPYEAEYNEDEFEEGEYEELDDEDEEKDEEEWRRLVGKDLLVDMEKSPKRNLVSQTDMKSSLA